ncbi:MAG: hypothetical protein LCH91_15775 [Bacteroidetes bacterium]|nr:hypothetical protein [Bacteroidota bacterium]
MKYVIIFLVLFLGFRSAVAQESEEAEQAIEYIKAQRLIAMRRAFDPSIDSLKEAEKILRAALHYYTTSQVQELAKSNSRLFGSKNSILYDLATVKIKMKQLDSAVILLIDPLTGISKGFFKQMIEQESIFSEIRNHPTIVSIFNAQKAAERLFNSDALSTPYQPNISEDEKIAGLSKLWSEAKYNFAYFDYIPDLDWDRLYLEFLPKIRATKSTVEYLYILKLFCAQLHDGHTDVWANDPKLKDLTSLRPPFRTVLIEDKVFVQEVQHDSLEKTGIHPGLEVINIDGLPVKEYAELYVRPYQSGSTTQNIDVATYTYRLLYGPKDAPVDVTFKNAKGEIFSRKLPRTGYRNLKTRPPFSFQIIPNNIAYIQLNGFEDNKVLSGFKAALDSIATTNALIIDVRQNGGGDSGYGWSILACLTDKPMLTGFYSSRIYSPLRRSRGETVVFEPVDGGNMWPVNGKYHYTKPVVVLTSGRTFSAAEDFVLVFDTMKRGIIIGEPTGGSTGQPLLFALPGGVMARVCTKRDMYPDGKEWNGKGIQPDLLVRPTAFDFQTGRDTVLEAAKKYLEADNKK